MYARTLKLWTHTIITQNKPVWWTNHTRHGCKAVWIPPNSNHSKQHLHLHKLHYSVQHYSELLQTWRGAYWLHEFEWVGGCISFIYIENSVTFSAAVTAFLHLRPQRTSPLYLLLFPTSTATLYRESDSFACINKKAALLFVSMTVHLYFLPPIVFRKVSWARGSYNFHKSCKSTTWKSTKLWFQSY